MVRYKTYNRFFLLNILLALTFVVSLIVLLTQVYRLLCIGEVASIIITDYIFLSYIIDIDLLTNNNLYYTCNYNDMLPKNTNLSSYIIY
jgi:hypothetical protein